MKPKLLNKDKSILRIVDYLKYKYNDIILIKDFWDADLCAIGLCDITEKYLIYISSFGLPNDRFNVVLDNMQSDKNTKIVGEFNAITYDKLEKVIIDHLKINKMD